MSEALYIEALRDIDQLESIELTKWEISFLESNLKRAHQTGFATFTNAQKEIIRNLVGKFLGEERLSEFHGQETFSWVRNRQ